MTGREFRKYPARIRYPSSYFIRCRNPLCFAHWLDIALERILPRRKCLLALQGNYLYIYSSDSPKVILAKFYSYAVYNGSREFRWLPLTQRRLNVVVSENSNGDFRRAKFVSCQLRNSHDAYECQRDFALCQARELSLKSHEREEREISAILDLYMR